ncbi:unnamed protein product [Adineta ricciae]|uniref:Uncharacterized protein n=1 Tax=Adineta ricciae TaxID=249248 RepID=A0A816G713_ADIRI|nr:unnamed protein product [Adineta ricciae]CAF1671233.1 unnamed protein product [Adineta ricciae]
MGASRKWGSCSRDCLCRSKIYFLEHKGIHRVAFNFKHWCVYLYVQCEIHGQQRWTVEKEFKKDHAAQDNQCFWNNCVVMWCGHYDSFLCTEKARCISNQPLNVAYNVAITWSSNGYNWMNDNCATFANDYDRRLPF